MVLEEGLPNPPNSPIEKIPEDFLIDNVRPELLNILSDNPTKDEILRAFAFYDDALNLYIQRHEREFKYWANTHTHGGFAGGGGPAEFSGSWLLGLSAMTTAITPKSDTGAFDDWGTMNTPDGTAVPRSLYWDPNTDKFLWGTGTKLWGASAESFETGSLVWEELYAPASGNWQGGGTGTPRTKILWIEELLLYVATGVIKSGNYHPYWAESLEGPWTECSSSSTGFGWNSTGPLMWDGEYVWTGGLGNVRGYRSADGKSFARSSEVYFALGFCGNYSLAGGSAASGGVQRAAPGGTFAPQTLDGADSTIQAREIAGTADGRAVVISNTYLHYTENGADFTRSLTHGISTTNRMFVHWDGIRWVAGGDGKVFTSIDGINWDELDPYPISSSNYYLAASKAPSLLELTEE